MMRDDARDATGDEDVVAQTEELAKFLSSYVDAGGSLDANEAPEEMKPLLQSMQQAFSTLSSTAGGGAQVAPTEMLDLIRQAAKGALRDPALEASTSERAPPVRVPTTRLSEKEIRLQPGFVVKSRDGNGGKVFINVCGSGEIGVPAAQDDTWREGLMPKEVIRALEAGASSASGEACLRFPLSAADARVDVDGSGQSCVVFDVVFNSTVMRHAVVFKTLKRFLAELCLKVVADKHVGMMDLSAEYKLPARAFIGRHPPPPHRIRATAPTVVEATESASAAEEPLDVDVEYHGRPVESVTIRLRVPNGIEKPREAVCVCIAREAITLDVPNRDSHRVELPFLVDADTARATLRRDNVICVTARYKAYSKALLLER